MSQINVVAAKNALYALLVAAPALEKLYTKVNGEAVNDDAKGCPWLGVYRGARAESPRTLGRSADNWACQPTFRVIVQEAGLDDPSVIEARLEDWVIAVIAAVKAEPTLGGNVQTTVAFAVNYSYWGDAEKGEVDAHFQQADIIITTEVRTS